MFTKEKIKKLEKFEKRIGIDLLVYIKIISGKPIYAINKISYEIEQWEYDTSDEEGLLVKRWFNEDAEEVMCLSYKDYGKNWSLSKGDLE